MWWCVGRAWPEDPSLSCALSAIPVLYQYALASMWLLGYEEEEIVIPQKLQQSVSGVISQKIKIRRHM